jgi:hypothetical protein
MKLARDNAPERRTESPEARLATELLIFELVHDSDRARRSLTPRRRTVNM